MADHQALEALFREHGYSDSRWLDPNSANIPRLPGRCQRRWRSTSSQR